MPSNPQTVRVVVVHDVLEEDLHDVLQDSELSHLLEIHRSLRADDRRCPDGAGIIARETRTNGDGGPEFEIELVALPW